MEIVNVLFVFLLTILISFVGSVQLGPVNISVIRASALKNYKSAVFIGLGGALPELIYASIALKGASFLAKFPNVLGYLSMVCIPLFLIIGLYFLIKNPKYNIAQNDIQNTTGASVFKSILIGFSIGIVNPMLLPFWILVLNIYHQYNLMLVYTTSYAIAFVMATAIGAFLLQYGLVWSIKRFKEKIEKYLLKYANTLTGWLFITLGIVQLYRLIYG